MTKALPNVIRKQVSECEKSERNKIRSVRVLYEGGLINLNVKRCKEMLTVVVVVLDFYRHLIQDLSQPPRKIL